MTVNSGEYLLDYTVLLWLVQHHTHDDYTTKWHSMHKCSLKLFCMHCECTLTTCSPCAHQLCGDATANCPCNTCIVLVVTTSCVAWRLGQLQLPNPVPHMLCCVVQGLYNKLIITYYYSGITHHTSKSTVLNKVTTALST